MKRSFHGLFAAALSVSPLQLYSADNLDLEGTTVIGNRELPKALHIVPWKAADSGDLAGRPLNSLVDQTLEPVDRDVFLRVGGWNPSTKE